MGWGSSRRYLPFHWSQFLFERANQPSNTTLTIAPTFFSVPFFLFFSLTITFYYSTLSLSHFRPAAAMVYTDIQNLRGLDQPVDYGSGIEYATGLVEALGGSSGNNDREKDLTKNNKQRSFGLQIGLWLNGTQGCQDIVSGALQENIDSFLQYLVQDIPDTIQIFLRVGYGTYRTDQNAGREKEGVPKK
jgi:hypothetical protein